jgi:hypothetical protein
MSGIYRMDCGHQTENCHSCACGIRLVTDPCVCRTYGAVINRRREKRRRCRSVQKQTRARVVMSHTSRGNLCLRRRLLSRLLVFVNSVSNCSFQAIDMQSAPVITKIKHRGEFRTRRGRRRLRSVYLIKYA